MAELGKTLPDFCRRRNHPRWPGTAPMVCGSALRRTKERVMTRFLSIAAVAGVLLGSTAILHAQGGGTGAGSGSFGASSGAGMQSEGGMGGPESSGSAADHESGRKDTLGRGDRERKIRSEGDDRTTGFGRDGDDRLRNDRDDQMMDNDARGIGKD